ncbi:MAG: methyltransferase domain-containing protein [Desulfobacula sp.]|nr:methyltransferase domain-containing protein [Desulfobacula sp.]
MKGFRINKEDYILQQIVPKSKILHVGCTNSPRTIERWNRRTLLHKKLCDHAEIIGSSVIGIDIDDTAISFLQLKMPDEIILNVDAHNLSKYFENDQRFDLIIAGDVIEHLPNPGLFLQSCNSVLSHNGRILITTTNAFNIVRFLKSFLFHEAVHNEHTAYYSHKTISRLISMSGLKCDDFGYYKCEPITEFSLNRVISNLIENSLCIFFPQFSEGIVIVAYKKNNL